MHHERDVSQEIAALFKDGFGPTGRFPEGKLTANDEGEIAFGVTHYRGKVILNFGMPIASLGMNAGQARALARSLQKHARAAHLIGSIVKDDHLKADGK